MFQLPSWQQIRPYVGSHRFSTVIKSPLYQKEGSKNISKVLEIIFICLLLRWKEDIQIIYNQLYIHTENVMICNSILKVQLKQKAEKCITMLFERATKYIFMYIHTHIYIQTINRSTCNSKNETFLPLKKCSQLNKPGNWDAWEFIASQSLAVPLTYVLVHRR